MLKQFQPLLEAFCSLGESSSFIWWFSELVLAKVHQSSVSPKLDEFVSVLKQIKQLAISCYHTHFSICILGGGRIVIQSTSRSNSIKSNDHRDTDQEV